MRYWTGLEADLLRMRDHMQRALDAIESADDSSVTRQRATDKLSRMYDGLQEALSGLWSVAPSEWELIENEKERA